MIELETRLLELIDWDEELLDLVYQRTSNLINSSKHKTRAQLEIDLYKDLQYLIPDEGIKLVISILDQLIRKEERVALA